MQCNMINLSNICLLKLIILFNQDKQHYLDKAAKRKAKHEKLKKKGTMFIPNLIDFVLLNSISNNILIL